MWTKIDSIDSDFKIWHSNQIELIEIIKIMKWLLEKLVKSKETAAQWCQEFMWQKKLVKSELENYLPKCQTISDWIYEVIVSPKIETKNNLTFKYLPTKLSNQRKRLHDGEKKSFCYSKKSVKSQHVNYLGTYVPWALPFNLTSFFTSR